MGTLTANIIAFTVEETSNSEVLQRARHSGFSGEALLVDLISGGFEAGGLQGGCEISS